MKVVVTGASGNVGTALLRGLDPDIEVTAIARRVPAEGPPYRNRLRRTGPSGRGAGRSALEPPPRRVARRA